MSSFSDHPRMSPRYPAGRRAARRQEGALAPLFVAAAILLLYVPLVSLGDYRVTIVGISALIVLVSTAASSFPNYRGIGFLLCALLYPLVLYGFHLALATPYAIPAPRFILSYGLWAISSLIIWAGFQNRCLFSGRYIYGALVFLTVLGMIQFFGAAVFNIWIGYDIVAALIRLDLNNSYLNLNVAEGIRAIGTYYEPSMVGRVVATLATICLFQGKPLFKILILLFLNIVTTRSMGLIVLTVLTMVFFGKLSVKHLLVLGLAGLVGAALFQDMILSRLSLGGGEAGNNSTYIRTVIPLDALGSILPEFPFGVPIGANERVVQNTIEGRYLYFTETKITNGLYEFIMYFGAAGFICIAFVLTQLGRNALMGRRGQAVILLYMLLSTAVSSSYLSIESSLLLYFLIVGVRQGEAAPKEARPMPVRLRYGVGAMTGAPPPRRRTSPPGMRPPGP